MSSDRCTTIETDRTHSPAIPSPLDHYDLQHDEASSCLRRRTKSFKWPPLVDCAIALALFISVQYLVLLAFRRPIIWDRRPEELDSPRFNLIARQFSGGLKYDDKGELYLDVSQGSELYVGNSSEADQSWQVYDAVQNIELDLAQTTDAELYRDKRNKIITIPDGFHQLHCLNQIRLALADPTYYMDGDLKRHLHVDHCVEYLRQALECQSDLTPLKLYYNKNPPRLMVDFEGTHTCRDFDAIIAWAHQHRTTTIT